MKQAQEVVLHPQEFSILNWSMYHVHMAARNRVQRLQGKYSHFHSVLLITSQWLITVIAIYKLQNIENEKKLRNVFFGLVRLPSGLTIEPS
jgi:hypothetical protein